MRSEGKARPLLQPGLLIHCHHDLSLSFSSRFVSGKPGSTVAFKKFLAIMKVLLVMPALVVKAADNNDNVCVRRSGVNICPEKSESV